MSREKEIFIRRATEKDIPHIAGVNAKVFAGNRDNPEKAGWWVSCLFKSFPLYQYFIAEVGGKFAGYIGWEMQGGYLRSDPAVKLGQLGSSPEEDEEKEAVELEQLGIDPDFAGMGIATKLTQESLEKHVIPWVAETNTRINSDINCIVWFYINNHNARRVYEKCGFTEECGRRKQYGDREEVCLKRKFPLVIPARDEE